MIKIIKLFVENDNVICKMDDIEVFNISNTNNTFKGLDIYNKLDIHKDDEFKFDENCANDCDNSSKNNPLFNNAKTYLEKLIEKLNSTITEFKNADYVTIFSERKFD